KATAKIKFDRTAPEQPFDFVFTEYSKDPGPPSLAPAVTTRAATGAPATPGPRTAAPNTSPLTPGGPTAQPSAASPKKPSVSAADPPTNQSPATEAPLI